MVLRELDVTLPPSTEVELEYVPVKVAPLLIVPDYAVVDCECLF